MRKFKFSILILLVAFSFFNIFSVISKDFGKKFLYSSFIDYYRGDLFEISKVRDFENKIIKIPEKKQTSTLENCDIITMGDSFFVANFDSPIFSELLGDKTSKKVFNVARDDFGNANDNPLEYLQKINYKKGTKKYLVLESVERYSRERIYRYSQPINIANIKEKTEYQKATTNISNFIPKDKLEYYYKNSVLASPLFEVTETFKFKTLKELNNQIGSYSLDPKNLFFIDEVTNTKTPFNDGDLNNMTNSLLYLKNELLNKYNIELIYLTIPNKYSIYGEYSKDKLSYNNFIPSLTKKLQANNINAPDIYTEFYNYHKASKDINEPLFYSGDTHFTQYGKEITLKQTISFIH